MRKVALSLFSLLMVFLAMSTTSSSQVVISVGFGPPALPVYEQPICPGEGYIWTPGYWAWDDDDGDYYWVPGTWVLAPEVGFLWTPPWWGWEDGRFFFHAGYWGPHVGFYGGVVYGFGYFGEGFEGGRWEHDHFFYNRSVTNVNVVNIHNVYNETVINNNVTVNRISYNGGPGGIHANPRPQDRMAEGERHLAPVGAQHEQLQQARGNRELRASVNEGKPPIAATGRAGEFSSHVAAREAGAPYHPPANRGNPPANRGNQPSGGETRGGNSPRPVHPNELPKFERPSPPNTGNANRDQKYQQQQNKMYAKQDQERQKLQQRQEQEHQRMERQNANQVQRQQMEQRHQQQTEQMQQRHVQQQQHMQQRQQPPEPRHK